MIEYNKAQVERIATNNGFVRDTYIYDELTTVLRMKCKE